MGFERSSKKRLSLFAQHSKQHTIDENLGAFLFGLSKPGHRSTEGKGQGLALKHLRPR